MRTAPPIRPATAGPALGGADGALRPTIRVDPRISARRIAVRRDEGRRRLRRLAWLGGAVATVALALASTRTPLLDLDRIEVAGADRLGADGVREAVAAAGLRPGAALVDLDLGAAEDALERLPSVAAAEVSRRWPDGVTIEVIERQPVATVAVTAGQALVAADGAVLAVTALADPAVAALVPVDGPTDLAAGDHLEAAELLAVASSVPDGLRPHLAGVGPGEGRGAVDLRLAAGGVVRLGAADQLAAKLVAAATVLGQVDTGCLAVVDVRVPSAPTVTRGPGC